MSCLVIELNKIFLKNLDSEYSSQINKNAIVDVAAWFHIEKVLIEVELRIQYQPQSFKNLNVEVIHFKVVF